jgi:hypothetical protein
MDGKKRIARLRNAEKWKRRGFDGPPMRLGLKVLKIINGPIKMDWPEELPMPLGFVPEKKNSYFNKYTSWLQKKGWERLGSGCFSTVYAKKDSDRVLKVTRRLDDWIDYVQWASKEGYAGNLAPRVYSWKRHGDWAVAVVERMATSSYDLDMEKNDQALLMSLLYPARRGNILAQCYMEDIQPGSFRFFEGLRANKMDGDIGGHNVMYRKDGTICITDPTAGEIKTEKKRLRSADFTSATPIYYEIRTNYLRAVSTYVCSYA